MLEESKVMMTQDSYTHKLPDGMLFETMIGTSAPMQAVFSSITKVAEVDVPVLILGESGTGKELAANAIHTLSVRKNGPFVPINCGAIPEALLESELFGNERGAFTGATFQRRGKLDYAQGGTLFLDEIGDLAPSLQVKILRFLQQKVIERVGGREPILVDCRIIAATHKNLDAAVKQHLFREDLYFRLAVVRITLPPLRDRGEDIVHLARNMGESFSKEMKKPVKALSANAIAALRTYHWPGNVRELQNRLQRALLLSEGPSITPADLELDQPQKPEATLRMAVHKLEREMIVKRLRDSNGNISRAARALGISRPTLYELIARHGLDPRLT